MFEIRMRHNANLPGQFLSKLQLWVEDPLLRLVYSISSCHEASGVFNTVADEEISGIGIEIEFFGCEKQVLLTPSECERLRNQVVAIVYNFGGIDVKQIEFDITWK